jgi:hypothetical protein
MVTQHITSNTTKRKRPRPHQKGRNVVPSPFDDIGVFPSFVIDPEINNISHIVQHSSMGTANHLTVREAVNMKLITLTAYGDKVAVFLKSSTVQVVLVPSTSLLKMLQPQPSERVH